MIDTDEVVNKAEELGVHPYNVQRDYIFGWVLARIYAANDLGKCSLTDRPKSYSNIVYCYI